MDPDQLATAKTMVPLSRTAVGGDARWQCATREPEGPPWLWGRRYQTRFFFRLSDIACGSYLPRQCNCGARTHCLVTLKICTHILSNPLISGRTDMGASATGRQRSPQLVSHSCIIIVALHVALRRGLCASP